MNKVKKAWEGLSPKAQRVILIAAAAAIAFVVIGSLVFAHLSTKKPEYTTLFTGLSADEATEITSLIEEEKVEYKYDAASGTINVPKDQADSLRAKLISQGYPKSGFTYDMYVKNSNLMATESDKKQYTLYELQDRLGSTIRLFDGVRDAKVTIAEDDDDTYALSSDDSNSEKTASASVVVTMQRGETLSEKSANAVRNLVARSVKGMNFTNVSVFDAATMTEVGDSSATGSTDNTEAVDSQTQKLENNIAANVKRVLAKLYKAGNVEVSVKGTLDTSSRVQENTTYSVPVQTDPDDKEGLLSKETESNAYTGDNATKAAGVAGTDANADTPQYTTQNGSNTTNDSNFNNDASREYLYNTQKEQTTTNPGTLQDLTVAVVIDTADMSIADNQLRQLIADAAGISRANADQKVSVIRTGVTKEAAKQSGSTNANNNGKMNPRQMILMAIIAGAGILIIFIILRILMARKAKRKEEEEEEAARLEEERLAKEKAEKEAAEAQARKLNEEEQADIHVARGEELKDSIGNFVETNPQAAAKLVEGWLRSEDDSVGRRKSRK
ncbi:MAG: flagellar basal-body MS-ring/collar protein FliF [Lachnospiraceae bacterium]|nr:flagellar basal-body MS-ring/collar protein FliF [Lachnospiraceae bacterium]